MKAACSDSGTKRVLVTVDACLPIKNSRDSGNFSFRHFHSLFGVKWYWSRDHLLLLVLSYFKLIKFETICVDFNATSRHSCKQSCWHESSLEKLSFKLSTRNRSFEQTNSPSDALDVVNSIFTRYFSMKTSSQESEYFWLCFKKSPGNLFTFRNFAALQWHDCWCPLSKSN